MKEIDFSEECMVFGGEEMRNYTAVSLVRLTCLELGSLRVAQ